MTPQIGTRSATPAWAGPGPAAGADYTIRRGDTLTSIAKAHGTTVEALLAANPQIRHRDTIYAGSRLHLPDPDEAAAPPAAQEEPAAEPGATLARMARDDNPPVRALAAAAAPASQPTLRKGAHGPAVADLQRRLAAAGFSPGPIDGRFGPRTEAAVRQFQASRGLVVDGLVGPQTWGALLGRPAVDTPPPAPPAPDGPQAPTAPGAPSEVGGPITRDEILARAHFWVDQNVPYSQSRYAPDAQGKLYRTDCSGLVSMALHLDGSPNTVSLPAHLTPIGWEELQPGDVVGTLGPGTGGDAGHVVLFNGWTDASHTAFKTLEERGGGRGAVESVRQVGYRVGDFVSAPYRYNQLVDGPAAPPAPAPGGGVAPGEAPQAVSRPSLHLGAHGPAVADLQRRLADAGFNPGPVDGDFGPRTQAAVRRFQAANGLTVDGWVGPQTWGALLGQAATGPAQAPANPPAAPAGLAAARQAAQAVVPGASQKNLDTYLPPILAELQARGLGDPDMLAMALATVRVESSGFAPISEYISKYNTSNGGRGQPFDLYDGRADLGNTQPGDGARFKGRGFVQLTGRANYTTIGRQIGVDLVRNPELANDPQVAAKILAQFLKNHEGRIRQAIASGDLTTARRAVNGGTHGLSDFIAGFNAGRRVLG